MERLLRDCTLGRASACSSRKLIGLKRQSHYKRCLRELSKYGITPVKSIPDSRVICCHVDKRRISTIQSLTKHPFVKYVEPDFKMRAHPITTSLSRPAKAVGRTRMLSAPSGARKDHGSKPWLKNFVHLPSPKTISLVNVTWNIRRVQAPLVWPITRGSSKKIGIIDTGIAKHPDLVVSGGINTINGSSFLDDNGHGTHVAGIAAARGTKGQIPGAAPRAALYAIKALNANGEGFVSDIIKGINWCIARKISVINMSLGLEGEKSAALREAVKRAHRKGIVIVASAGNSGINSGGIDEPASFPETIAVAASTISNRIAPYSSRGRGVSISAPGNNIRSTWLRNGYKILSGTSMASPHVAGGAALLLAVEPNLKPTQVRSRLQSTASRLTGYGPRSQGAGLLQIASYCVEE
ncbi:S8 family peptidase [Paenibacillus baekrokdamisoli]|uniref:S8 family peptidase n=1 Tax=Paenibacillus baekrokdamisoli TaxID=1712516 RepID=UPI001E28C39C|nr:S8 family peptidase [Paenibacillus baekrokdamisoli]